MSNYYIAVNALLNGFDYNTIEVTCEGDRGFVSHALLLKSDPNVKFGIPGPGIYKINIYGCNDRDIDLIKTWHVTWPSDQFYPLLPTC